MRRVSRPSCEDGPLLEEQETEGQRQLHSLLQQQLHTHVQIERCVAKRQCFAPAALYRPFGEQAAGVRSLSQFQALKDGEEELVGLRELGLTEPEIRLWLSRDRGLQPCGVSAAPGATEQRLQVIRDKMEARAELLARPQRFNTSRPLSRRQMEIERALFQGSDRQGFLTALYHRDEETQENQQGASHSDPMDQVYREILRREELPPRGESSPPRGESSPPRGESSPPRGESSPPPRGESSESSQPPPPPPPRVESSPPQGESSPPRGESSESSPPRRDRRSQIEASRRIGSLSCVAAAAAAATPLTVRGHVETLTDEEILRNRESEDEIRKIPRFRNYQPGTPSKVLCVKNLSSGASLAQLVALFSRFQRRGADPVLYRLLTGRLRGQAFITLPDPQTAHDALRLLHGYRLLGKPLVVEFSRQRREEEEH